MDEVTRLGLAAVERCEARTRELANLNLLITPGFERAREQLARGLVPAGPLAGRTVAVKDMIDVAGLRTTRGGVLDVERVASASAPVVTALEKAGAVVMGKANQHEFAWGVTSDNPHWGRVGNPRHPRHIPGGSSGGTAAALAAGAADLGLGTDTAGSVRIPSACCGTVGLRPRVGLLPEQGVAPLAPGFDVVGLMASTVGDCAELWAVLTRTAVPAAIDPRGLTVGVVEDAPFAGELERAAARLRPVTIPDAIYRPFRTLLASRAAATHAQTFPRDATRYGRDVRTKLLAGLALSKEDVDAARVELSRVRTAFLSQIADVDLIVSRTLGSRVPPAGADDLAVRDGLGRLTIPASAFDLAALAIGDLQLMATDERLLLGVGRWWEQRCREIPSPDFEPPDDTART
jgi:Asp-tRNA(Asn)/Glu-tRNA(Gln) amidotransferase A subunit family amidase